MTDVFISYSRKDSDFGRKLHNELTKNGRDVWMDWEDIPPTVGFWAEICKGIERTNNFVLIMSPDSLGSPICQMEIEYARQLSKRIIPILHRDPEWDAAALSAMNRTRTDDFVRKLLAERDVLRLSGDNREILAGLNWIFFTEKEDFAKQFQVLNEALDLDLVHVELHTTLMIRALEWQKNDKNAGYVLTGDELVAAENWLNAAAGKKPAVNDLHQTYIANSRTVENRRRRLLRNLQTASGVLAIMIVLAIIAAVFAVNQANAAQTERDAALVEKSTAVAAAATAANAVNVANSTLTVIPGTLSAADAQLSHATATLGYVQNQGTKVAAQATYFGIEQARIGTLAVGGVVIPPGTLTPALLIPALTDVAELLEWQPQIIIEEINGIQIEMVKVPAGCFMMGSLAYADTQPVNEQCFSTPFFIDRYEVTNQQYEQISQSTVSYYLGENYPVQFVSWFQAHDFCALRGARLPSEAEWEYAARGPDSLLYPWGKDAHASDENWFIGSTRYDRAERVTDSSGNPMRPNGSSWVGAIDMLGNVMEWTNTIYDYVIDATSSTPPIYDQRFPYPYANDGREINNEIIEAIYNDNTIRDENAEAKVIIVVLRGGSYDYYQSLYLSTTARAGGTINGTPQFAGFRCVRSDRVGF